MVVRMTLHKRARTLKIHERLRRLAPWVMSRRTRRRIAEAPSWVAKMMAVRMAVSLTYSMSMVLNSMVDPSGPMSSKVWLKMSKWFGSRSPGTDSSTGQDMIAVCGLRRLLVGWLWSCLY